MTRTNELVLGMIRDFERGKLSIDEVLELRDAYESELARKEAALRGMAAQLHAVHAIDQVPFLKGAIGAALQIYDSALTPARETGETK